ncbi:hypothetical protein CMV_005816 [Castanea mollissima]|uniref:Uncharacterized protein n=1 Tax=Castanea mollissima TaxID=60419 RepID=A0A8J4VRU1_9ROSI|nr:hypothetical protein CMV_005816 [Castanea mollissima]
MRRNMPRLYNTEWPNQSTFSCNDSAVTQCQPPLVSHETGHLSLPIDSRLQLDVTNGLQSISTAEENENLLIKFLEYMTRASNGCDKWV